MVARSQYQITPADLAIVLAMVRGGTLAQAGERIGMNASTVFRSLQRLERGLGQSLFERGRTGYAASELARSLAERAEEMEAVLEAARSSIEVEPSQVSGSVRITTTDTILHGLVAPALRSLHDEHPLLQFELHTGNEVASLTRRDADIAVRATKKPPQHLVGKQVGAIKVALYAAKPFKPRRPSNTQLGALNWIAPDDALPEHPSVVWRKRHFPRLQPRYRVNSILSVLELVALGMGVGVVPVFLAAGRSDVVQISEVLEECETDLWLLTHPESRHLRRISAAYSHLSRHLQLP